MSVRQEKGKWMIDIDYILPDGNKAPRIRKVAPIQTRRAAEQYEREIRVNLAAGTYGKEKKKREKTESFADDFLKSYVVNNNKNSVLITKTGILKNHLLPVFGSMHSIVAGLALGR